MRVLGDVTEGNALDVLRQVDEIYINTIRDFGLYDKIWQAFAVFLPVRQAPQIPSFNLAIVYSDLCRQPENVFSPACCSTIHQLNPSIIERDKGVL